MTDHTPMWAAPGEGWAAPRVTRAPGAYGGPPGRFADPGAFFGNPYETAPKLTEAEVRAEERAMVVQEMRETYERMFPTDAAARLRVEWVVKVVEGADDGVHLKNG